MKAHQKIRLNKDKILAQLKSLASIAEINGWVFEYDQEIDELIFGVDYMPRDSFLFNINDELNLFLSPDSTINGTHIEYFNSNYLEHNKELKPVLEYIKAKKRSTKKSNTAKTALEIEIMADAFKSLFGKDELVTAI